MIPTKITIHFVHAQLPYMRLHTLTKFEFYNNLTRTKQPTNLCSKNHEESLTNNTKDFKWQKQAFTVVLKQALDGSVFDEFLQFFNNC